MVFFHDRRTWGGGALEMYGAHALSPPPAFPLVEDNYEKQFTVDIGFPVQIHKTLIQFPYIQFHACSSILRIWF